MQKSLPSKGLISAARPFAVNKFREALYGNFAVEKFTSSANLP